MINQGVEFNNQYNQARLKSQQTKRDPLVTRWLKLNTSCLMVLNSFGAKFIGHMILLRRVKMAPQKISETQKLLRLNFAQVKAPSDANPSLRLDIFKYVANE